MHATNITKHNYETEVLHSDKPVLLDFWAERCGPCRFISPTIDEIARENPEIKVCKVNVDEQHELAAQYKVMSVPSMFAVKNGRVVDLAVGVRSKQQILGMFK